jgi:glycine/D-amino acid oxidase-like deaminating enzyme/nitrite reductase/ring-hydroxylating ferredoxin subunit
MNASYWLATTEPTAYPPLTGEVEADVAVIGGGIAGLCAAWELACAGRSVVVCEAGRLAAGVTGHTTAKLTAQHGLIYDRLRGSLGADAAATYARTQTDAMLHVIGVTERLGIDCDLERAPAVRYTTEADQVPAFEAEVEAARAAGLPASLVTSTDLPYPIVAGIRFEDQAQFHPRRFLLGLVTDLTVHKGQIFEGTRVSGLREGDPHRLSTEDGGTIRARDVVVATHYPIFDRALLFPRLNPSREVVVAAPIPAERAPEGMYITADGGSRSVRTAPYRDGQRLLIITGEHFRPGTAGVEERFATLTTWTRETFGVDEFPYRWAAQDNATTDGVPFIGPLKRGSRRLWVAAGFGGWGMTNGVLAGRLLAALVRGEEPDGAALYDPRRVHPTTEAGPVLSGVLEVARHFVGDRLKPVPTDPATLEPGQGAVMKLDGHRCAVYRDPEGELHVVSARCTHMSCVVGFNDAERTWDCPCHGSRFDVDGAVIQGPATKPLPARRIGD